MGLMSARRPGVTTAHPTLPSFLGHVLIENRHHLVVDSRITLADGYGERAVAQEMVADLKGKPSQNYRCRQEL